MLIPERAGVMILDGTCVLPQGILPLHIFEPRYRKMLSEALEAHRMFCVAMQKPESARETPMPVASLGLIRACVRSPDGTSNLVLQGIARVRLGRATQLKPYRIHPITALNPAPPQSESVDALRLRVVELVDRRLRTGPDLHPDMLRQLAKASGCESAGLDDCLAQLRRMPDPGRMADLITLLMLPDPMARLAIHQAVDVEDRLRMLIVLLRPDPGEKAKG